MNSLPKAYDRRPVEEKYIAWWLERDYFHATVRGREVEGAPSVGKGPFCIVIPPPNVTAPLHMGHALDLMIQDVLTRWRRMQGYDALWLPGTDHAGIATQNVVERELSDRGTNRHELGRERFVEEVWKWKEQTHGRIMKQLRRLGASCDWARERFTLDEGCSRAVREAFTRLYREGLIYRGERMTNWCPRCVTALSDIEVEHKEVQGSLYYIRYPLAEPDTSAGGESQEPSFLVVATTRPETMLGDTAVAANPSDERHSRLAGRKVTLPLVSRELPIVFDERVQPEFGTGLVKITPAHDPDDFALGLEHGLPQVVVIGSQGEMNENAGEYAGLDRYEARKRIVADLTRLGLLEKVEPHVHSVGHCQRCGTTVEPMVSLQWFVKMEPLAELGIEATRSGRVRFVPPRWERVYLEWLENIRDWCISRQLWWGHRIPVWYCQDCAEENVEVEAPQRCRRCGSDKLAQDEDVLDTWFSSALWPFSTLGWPDKTEEMDYFYPTSVLVTAYDIIYFWVARMIMMGEKLVGCEPFRNVWIHGLVRDSKGRKMSKSEGNVIDPLEIVERHGADVLRYALASASALGQDLRLTEERLTGARNFCNKIWNAARFVLQSSESLAEVSVAAPDIPTLNRDDPDDIPHRWIVSRLQKAAAAVNDALENYRLDEACSAAYSFFWNEFCDWYVEISKFLLRDTESEPAARRAGKALAVLRHCLRATMMLLHPVMPFITEEVWQRLNETEPGSSQPESICIAPWPEAKEEWVDGKAEEQMDNVTDAIRTVREIRVSLGLAGNDRATYICAMGRPEAWAEGVWDEIGQALTGSLRYFSKMAGVGRVTIHGPERVRWFPGGTPGFRLAAGGRLRIYVSAEAEEIERGLQALGGKLAKIDQELAGLEKQLSDQQFLQNAPREVQDKKKDRHSAAQAERSQLQVQIELIEKVILGRRDSENKDQDN